VLASTDDHGRVVEHRVPEIDARWSSTVHQPGRCRKTVTKLGHSTLPLCSKEPKQMFSSSVSDSFRDICVCHTDGEMLYNTCCHHSWHRIWHSTNSYCSVILLFVAVRQ